MLDVLPLSSHLGFIARAFMLGGMKSMCKGILMVGLAVSARGETLVDRLLASYDGVQSMQGEIRKDTKAGGLEVRKLSRVYFARPDQLNVETFSPVKRRIVADGTTFFSFMEGDPKGFSRPVARLDEDWLISLRQVPGTPMDQLLRLKGLPEQELPPTETAPVRRGYQAAKVYVVLEAETNSRLNAIEFYADPDLAQRTARFDYSAYTELAPGLWFPLLHKARLQQGGVESEETTRVSNAVVNQPIPAALFLPATFFKGVEFTDNLDDIYGK